MSYRLRFIDQYPGIGWVGSHNSATKCNCHVKIHHFHQTDLTHAWARRLVTCLREGDGLLKSIANTLSSNQVPRNRCSRSPGQLVPNLGIFVQATATVQSKNCLQFSGLNHSHSLLSLVLNAHGSAGLCNSAPFPSVDACIVRGVSSTWCALDSLW